MCVRGCVCVWVGGCVCVCVWDVTWVLPYIAAPSTADLLHTWSVSYVFRTAPKKHTLLREAESLQQKTLFVFHSDSEYTEECMPITVQLPHGEGKRKRDSQGMIPVPVLWHAMSVKKIPGSNTSAARISAAGTVTIK